MKNFLRSKLVVFFSLFFISILSSFGQGLETFDNHALSGTTYVDGSFIGNNGITWNYKQVTGEQDYPIDGKGVLLRRSDAPSSVKSGIISGGIQNFSVQLRKAFTSTGERQVELFINDISKGQSILFGSSTGADATIHTFSVENINIAGDFTIEIRHITGNTSNRQLVIDNISWTGYTGGTPTVSTPTITPAGGHVFQPVTANITTATDGATIYYSTVSETGPWTEYTSALNIASTTTLWAYAAKEGMDNSAVRSVTYTFPIEVADIAALRAGTTGGQLYKLTGEAVLTLKVDNRNQKYIQDASGAILIDDPSPAKITTSYNLGDGITGLTGSLTTYANMLQFVPVTDAGEATSTGKKIVPEIVVLADLNSSYQAKLVRVKGATFSATGNFATGTNYTISADGDDGILRTAYSDLNYIGQPIPEGSQDITGVVLQFNSDLQLVPRSLADIVPAGTSSIRDNQAVDVIIYPNPVINEIRVLSLESIAKVEVTNMAGQVVANSFKVVGQEVVVPVNSKVNGVVVVKITTESGKVVVKKVLKQ